MSERVGGTTSMFPGNETHTQTYNIVVKTLCTATRLFLSTKTKTQQIEKKTKNDALLNRRKRKKKDEKNERNSYNPVYLYATSVSLVAS
jgi:hypothetical protein